jgi:uncharacterized sporulation protein YeaH/YhbH (DUF444 family)
MASDGNTIEQEAERRLSILFQDLLAVANRHASNTYTYVEIISTTTIAVTTRYRTPDGVDYDIHQTISLDYGTRERK